jgi:hypothetical protein
MATVSLTCLGIGIAGAMLGACVGFLTFALMRVTGEPRGPKVDRNARSGKGASVGF